MVISEYDKVPLFLLIVEFSLQKLSVCTECPAQIVQRILRNIFPRGLSSTHRKPRQNLGRKKTGMMKIMIMLSTQGFGIQEVRDGSN